MSVPSIVSTDPSNVKLPANPLTCCNTKVDWLSPVLFLFPFMLLHWISPALFTHSDLPKPTAIPKKASDIGDGSTRPIAGVSTYRIPPSKMDRILKVCRARGITFTPLLIVMWMSTLTSDYYPHAWLTVSRWSCDIRPYIDLTKVGGATEGGVMTQGTSGLVYIQRAAPYRQLVLSKPGKDDKETRIDVGTAWELVRRYKAKMPPKIADLAVARWNGAELMGTDLEVQMANSFFTFKAFRKSAHISNIDLFSPYMPGDSADDARHRIWTISDVQFLTAPTHGNIGSQSPILSVMGIKGGDTVINAEFTTGIYTREAVDEMLALIMEKLLALVEASSEVGETDL